MLNNRWKKLFFILFSVNLLILIAIISLSLLPASNQTEIIKDKQSSKQEMVAFPLETNKEDLNKVINHYLKKEVGKGAINYKVLLKDEVELFGTISFFDEDLQLRLTFEPEALPNGDLILKQKSISIGQMYLPVSYVLKFVADKYKLPNWVTIDPKNEEVYLAFQKLKLKSDLKVRVSEFDLKNDKILLTLNVPTE